MRKLGLTLVLVSGAVAPLAAQRLWQPEIGLRATFMRLDDPNSDAYVDLIDVPGVGGLGAAAVNPSTLYGIIPIGDRIAIQPTFGLYNFSYGFAFGGIVVTTVSAGVRVNVALSQDFYAAVGPNAYIVKASGQEDTQGALEGALGYRGTVGAHFKSSVELFYERREESEQTMALNAYGLRVGMGYSFGGEAGERRASAGPALSSDRMWTPSIALQGGWSLVSIPGQVDYTTLALPFAGQNVGLIAAPGPNALSVLLPVGERLAVEPTFDFHTYKLKDGDRLTSYQFGARMNYAFSRAAFGAVGLEYSGISSDGVDDGSRFGALMAAGFRFPLGAGLSGRTELDFRIFDASDASPSGQVTSFVFGVLVPVN